MSERQTIFLFYFLCSTMRITKCNEFSRNRDLWFVTWKFMENNATSLEKMKFFTKHSALLKSNGKQMTGNFSLLRWIFALYLCVLHLVLFTSHRFELSPQMTTNFGELWKKDLFIKLEPWNFDLRWKERNVKIYMKSSLLMRTDSFSTSCRQYSIWNIFVLFHLWNCFSWLQN